MPYIKVSSGVLASMGTTLQTAATKVTSIGDSFSGIARNLDWDVKAESDIQRKINSINTSLEDHRTMLQSMYQFALQAKSKYEALDSADSPSGSSGGGGTGSASSTWDTFVEEFKKEYTLDDLLAGGNYIPKIMGFVKDVKGAKSWSDMYKTGGEIKDFLVDAADTYRRYMKTGNIHGKTTATVNWLKHITGYKKLGRASSAKEVWSRFKCNLTNKTSPFNAQFKKTVGDFTGKNGVGKAIGKWGGVLLDGVTNFFSNKEEQAASGGKMSDGRVIAETITETVVGTIITHGASIVVGAAVTAVLGPVAAPGIVVTALTGLVLSGVNAGVKALTGKSTTEFISDGILNVGAAIGNGAKNAAKAVGNWFNKIF